MDAAADYSHTNPRRPGRPAGFGVLDGALTLALIAIGAAVAIGIWSSTGRNRQTQELIAEIQAIRTSMTKAYGDTLTQADPHLSTTGATPAALGRLGLIDPKYLRGSPATLVNPWGQPMAVTLLATGGSGTGYTIDPGAIPQDACITYLNSLVGDPELTGVNYNADEATSAGSLTPSGGSWAGSPLSLTPGMTNTACALLAGSAGPVAEFLNSHALAGSLVSFSGVLPTNVTLGSATFQEITASAASLTGTSSAVSNNPSISIAPTGNPANPLQGAFTADNLNLSATSPADVASSQTGTAASISGSFTYTSIASGTGVHEVEIIPTGSVVDPNIGTTGYDPSNSPGYLINVTLTNPNSATPNTPVFSGTLIQTATQTIWTGSVPNGGLIPACANNSCTTLDVTYTAQAYGGAGTAPLARSAALSSFQVVGQ